MTTSNFADRLLFLMQAVGRIPEMRGRQRKVLVLKTLDAVLANSPGISVGGRNAFTQMASHLIESLLDAASGRYDFGNSPAEGFFPCCSS